jgi:hypothetical protein
VLPQHAGQRLEFRHGECIERGSGRRQRVSAAIHIAAFAYFAVKFFSAVVVRATISTHRYSTQLVLQHGINEREEYRNTKEKHLADETEEEHYEEHYEERRGEWNDQ